MRLCKCVGSSGGAGEGNRRCEDFKKGGKPFCKDFDEEGEDSEGKKHKLYMSLSIDMFRCVQTTLYCPGWI